MSSSLEKIYESNSEIQERKISATSTKIICLFPFMDEFESQNSWRDFAENIIIILYCYSYY